jgi:hypothetical protein
MGTLPVWVTETVDDSGDAGLYASLRIDSSGRPNVAYWTGLETPEAKLMFARKEGPTWAIETVSAARGTAAALVLDRTDRPWIAYYDLEASSVMVAHKESTGWSLDTAISGLRGFAVGNTAIAILNDRPVVSFWSDAGLQIARRSAAGTWLSAETIDPNPRAGFNNSMTVDASGVLHLSYYDLSTESLKHARVDAAGSASFETVESGPAGFAGEHSSIAAGSQLHTAYSSHSGVHHARFSNGTWLVDSVEPGGHEFPSIVLDRDARPQISYYDAVSKTLKIAQFTDHFQITTVDQSGDVGGYSSLAIDASGQPRIAYHDVTRGALKFARSVPPPKASITRIPGGTVRLFELDGSASTGDDLKFQWSLDREGVAALSSSTNPRLVVQLTGPPDDYVFTLTVTDAQQRQDRASITIHIT